MLKIIIKERHVRLTCPTGVFILLFCLVQIGCSRKPDIIDRKNVRSMVITAFETHFSPKVIVNSDSMQVILEKLNDARKEPLKMRTTYKIDIYYKDGRSTAVYCNPSAIKIEGNTYKLREKIGEFLELGAATK